MAVLETVRKAIAEGDLDLLSQPSPPCLTAGHMECQWAHTEGRVLGICRTN